MLVMSDVTEPVEGVHAMTKRQGRTGPIEVKGLLERDEDFVRAAVEMLVQAALEAEMAEAIGAEKGERTATRLAYRSGYYSRSLDTGRGAGAAGAAGPGGPVLDRPPDLIRGATSARRRRWWGRWPRCTCRASRRAR